MEYEVMDEEMLGMANNPSCEEALPEGIDFISSHCSGSSSNNPIKDDGVTMNEIPNENVTNYVDGPLWTAEVVEECMSALGGDDSIKFPNEEAAVLGGNDSIKFLNEEAAALGGNDSIEFLNKEAAHRESDDKEKANSVAFIPLKEIDEERSMAIFREFMNRLVTFSLNVPAKEILEYFGSCLPASVNVASDQRELLEKCNLQEKEIHELRIALDTSNREKAELEFLRDAKELEHRKMCEAWHNAVKELESTLSVNEVERTKAYERLSESDNNKRELEVLVANREQEIAMLRLQQTKLYTIMESLRKREINYVKAGLQLAADVANKYDKKYIADEILKINPYRDYCKRKSPSQSNPAA